ncbi:MAG TPA: hypothetical protein VEK56_08295 [Vicinamibacterales bacterium]|nr:hypothetical protein [Vicinamibacterales bacterium]
MSLTSGPGDLPRCTIPGIDSLIKRLYDDRYAVKVTPRKIGSRGQPDAFDAPQPFANLVPTGGS